MEPKPEKHLLFSITQKDLKIDFFRCGGNGGQNVNKRSTGCRITHSPSGAVAESREHRTQLANKKAAFERLCEHKALKSWIMVQAAAKMQGYRDLEAKIDDMMKEENLKIETFVPDDVLDGDESESD